MAMPAADKGPEGQARRIAYRAAPQEAEAREPSGLTGPEAGWPGAARSAPSERAGSIQFLLLTLVEDHVVQPVGADEAEHLPVLQSGAVPCRG